MPTIYNAFADWQHERRIFWAGFHCLISAAWDEYAMLFAECGEDEGNALANAAYDCWRDLIALRREFERTLPTFGI